MSLAVAQTAGACVAGREWTRPFIFAETGIEVSRAINIRGLAVGSSLASACIKSSLGILRARVRFSSPFTLFMAGEKHPAEGAPGASSQALPLLHRRVSHQE